MNKFIVFTAFILSFSIFSFSQISQSRKDSLIENSESPVDTIRLNALKQLTWESRFTEPLEGFEYAFDALSLAEDLNRLEDMATIHNFIGVIATKINSLDKAKVHILKAYRISDSLNFQREKAYALNNLGEIYYQTGKPDSAINQLNGSIELFKEINDLNGLAYAYNQMGMAQRKLKKYDEAFKFHNLCLEIRIKLDHKDFVAKTLLHMGVDLLEKGSYPEAREYFEKIDKSRFEERPYFSLAYHYILVGKTYLGEKNDNMAIQYFKDAYRLAQKSELFPELRDAAKLLSDIYEAQQFHKTALFYLNMYKTWDDSVKNSDLVAEYKQIELRKAFEQKYKFLEYKMKKDLESKELKLFWNRVLISGFFGFSLLLLIFLIILVKKSRIIAKQNKLLLLQKEDIESKNTELNAQNLQISEQNKAISQQRDELAIANATKDKFFAIIAHDLRGPVGNLTAFFNLIIDSYQDKIDPKLMEFFLVVNASVQQTYTLLENLLTWSQLQNGSIPYNPLKNNLFTTVDNNINLLSAKSNEKNISVVNTMPKEVILKFDTYMLDTVIRNLLSNAIKFTNSGGTISFSSSKKGNFIELKISDTGIGISKSEIDKLYRIDVRHKTKEGTSGEKGTGLGLILCKEFMEKHGGTISVESVQGKGSTFIISLPLDE